MYGKQNIFVHCIYLNLLENSLQACIHTLNNEQVSIGKKRKKKERMNGKIRKLELCYLGKAFC